MKFLLNDIFQTNEQGGQGSRRKVRELIMDANAQYALVIPTFATDERKPVEVGEIRYNGGGAVYGLCVDYLSLQPSNSEFAGRATWLVIGGQGRLAQIAELPQNIVFNNQSS